MPALADGRVGLSFGRVADEYERVRPEYTEEAVDHVAWGLGLEPTATVLDLAAGTGKLTRVLQRRFAHVIAVEPDDAMRAKIDGDARAGSAESIPVADVSVDAVFVGDAFHWFDAPVALREIRRVLRGGGGLALLSNHWPIPEDGEARRLLDEVWRRFHGDTRFEATWVAELEQALGPFERAVFERELVLDNEAYAELCVTGSCPSALPDDERELLRRGLAENFDAVVRLTAPVEAWWVRT